MTEAYKVIKAMIHTEKGSIAESRGKYLFWVDTEANKIEIKKAFEEIYKKRVSKVNTLVVPGKKKRVRYKEGYTSEWKKAQVTLRKGEKLDVA